ncbi:hypothetical protein QTP70_029109 [Hemibagrus guttatus]|uniref:Reverse transcriptase domain-containing protein n=1 Tax=Hemibagrus guttatus TaxID=175788 RepID=A0AAE0QAI9_9TELE|nr:hypothetical protein QTP70_029109 [Hemibagrus guttatus]
MDTKMLDISGLPMFYRGLFKTWNVFKKQNKGYRTVHWLLEEPLVDSRRLDISGVTIPALSRTFISSGIVTLRELVNIAGSDLSRAEDLAACMGLRSWRVVNQLLHRWRSALTVRDPESFPGQPRDIVSPTCPGFSTGSLPGEACPEHLPRETSRRHLKQMPEPPQLSPFDVEEQRLYSELLPGDRAPYPIAKGAPRHPTEEAHFGRLYPGSYPFGHDPELMTIVAASMPELMQLWSTCIYEEERHVDSSVNRVSCREMSRSRTARVKLFQVEKLVLFVISTPYNHIILGFPWLQTFPASPHHWKAWSPCTPIKSMEYHDLQEVFSKEKVTQLPPHQPCDCAIELLPNTMPPKSKIYPLLVPTTKAIESYIEEALAVGFIQPFISPAAAGFFYVEKKDGGLRPCIDYRRLNSITVCYPYLLPRVSSALEQLQETQFFTKLDLHGAFNLVQKPDPEHLREEIFLDRNLPRSAIQEGDKVQT